ncbi:hypothetical protein HMPREF3157_00460 [Dermabacter sp. HMSC06F07]|uniref:sugar-binding transcriptional regulator n=1 Tax=Dermabacter TaxID=36739 RepID=UPI0008A3A865|nr:sugar-binding domain-containing protein [Dermabacter sp. HMSC06F07]MCT1709906.1 hypothetical protein [Dermabacter hominis]MDK8803902.1 sugar-binding domain-containing protein [Dermabacter hominis]OFT48634.1 hypothetical protein HMPREF3157_00460 [Dermabacter sp. HMSC06F07]WIK61719.1 sugar-binding domain-containing protein [Dermabacter hominis]
MALKRDRRTLIDVARLYYVDGLDQSTIGESMGLSKSTVSRILTAAKEEGIIQVRIVGDDVERNEELERQITELYDIERVFVAASGSDPYEATSRLAAQRFIELAPHAGRIGFGWGLTIQRMIQAIPTRSLGAEHVLTPLVGGMPTADTAPSGNNMIVALAERLGCRSERFDAPAVVESSRTWNALMSESSVRTALENARATDLAFVGIGTHGVHTSRLVIDAMKLNDEQLARYLAQNPAGDMCGHYFDPDGKPLGSPTTNRVIGLTIENLQNLPRVIGIAAGNDRLPGLTGAIHTGALAELCIDEEIARSLVRATGVGPGRADSGERCVCSACGAPHPRAAR